ncbi:MAG: class I SAM-dependent RNA methyltransferase [Oscillospiraceae bacterium]|jgi:putative N6-adenine-specific DNA methylase|nr:class I SAM-dependent RNA methyltransferase [Oscillospiraceae bacterium]
MENIRMVAPCLFGTEGIVAQDLKRMDARNVQAENGRVFFEGDFNILARANIRSSCAERILIELGSFKAESFDELFEGTKALPWENFLGKRNAFPVKGRSITSKLSSLPSCQSIIKKAIAERLSAAYQIPWFEETGSKQQVQFFIFKDKVSLMLDTSGDGLHKRGYRASSVEAPIKETLASAICDTVRIFPDSIVYDPLCGSGTLLIEAAYRAMRIAPGIKRRFACEKWDNIPASVFKEERELAKSLIKKDACFHAFGGDIDPQAIALTLENAAKAAVPQRISAAQEDIKDLSLTGEKGTLICNPPYGERLLDIESARELYKILGEKCIPKKGWSYAIISPDEEFEQHFGRKANRQRKLYNGMIECRLYVYYSGE